MNDMYNILKKSQTAVRTPPPELTGAKSALTGAKMVNHHNMVISVPFYTKLVAIVPY